MAMSVSLPGSKGERPQVPRLPHPPPDIHPSFDFEDSPTPIFCLLGPLYAIYEHDHPPVHEVFFHLLQDSVIPANPDADPEGADHWHQLCGETPRVARRTRRREALDEPLHEYVAVGSPSWRGWELTRQHDV